MKDYNELKSILPGLQEDMPKPFYMIGELLDYGSFELCIQEKDGRKEYIIPYIMNDAVILRWRMRRGAVITSRNRK